MQAQKHLLSQIINNGDYSLIDDEIPGYFYDPHLKEILKLGYEIHLGTGKGIDYDDLKTRINQRFKDPYRRPILHKLGEVEKMIDSPILDDIKGEVRAEFEQNLLNGLQSVLQDKTKTNQNKIDFLKKVTHKLEGDQRQGKTKLSFLIKKFEEDFKNGKPGKYYDAQIDLSRSPTLKKIFTPIIYPVPYVIGAEPNDCKTTLLMALHKHLVDEGKTVYHLTLEDTPEGYTMKYLGPELGIPKSDIFTNRVRKEDFLGLRPFTKGDVIINNKRMTASELLWDVSQLCQKQKIDLVSVDYIQRIAGEKGQDDRSKIAELSGVLMQISNDQYIPTIALSQPTKDPKRTGGLKGNDLKGAQEIFSDARAILILNNSNKVDNLKDFEWVKTTNFGKFGGMIDFNLEVGNINHVEVQRNERNNKPIN